jgi:hypothetical protein
MRPTILVELRPTTLASSVDLIADSFLNQERDAPSSLCSSRIRQEARPPSRSDHILVELLPTTTLASSVRGTNSRLLLNQEHNGPSVSDKKQDLLTPPLTFDTTFDTTFDL